jgi:hypothetical protein
MALVIHILIALTSIGYTTYIFFSPSDRKIKLSYLLVGSTVASGTYLVISRPPVHILQVCTTGLVYIGAMSVGIVLAKHKLARSKIKSNDLN